MSELTEEEVQRRQKVRETRREELRQRFVSLLSTNPHHVRPYLVQGFNLAYSRIVSQLSRELMRRPHHRSIREHEETITMLAADLACAEMETGMWLLLEAQKVVGEQEGSANLTEAEIEALRNLTRSGPPS